MSLSVVCVSIGLLINGLVVTQQKCTVSSTLNNIMAVPLISIFLTSGNGSDTIMIGISNIWDLVETQEIRIIYVLPFSQHFMFFVCFYILNVYSAICLCCAKNVDI